MGTKTYYSVKWFVRKPKVETVQVSVLDERHQYHESLMAMLADPSTASYPYVKSPSADSVSIPARVLYPHNVKVDNGESALHGTFQSQFTAYPEPKARTRDPKLVGMPRGADPVICSTGWHVPFLSHLEQFIPQVHQSRDGEAELWLVKVGGRHTRVTQSGYDRQKAAFEFIELRKKLDLGQTIKLMKVIGEAVKARESGAVFDGKVREVYPQWNAPDRAAIQHRNQVNRPLRALVSHLRELDRGPSPDSWRSGRIGSGKFALLDPASIEEAEAITK